MTEEAKSISRLKFSNFKLRALLNITRSIVANSPVNQLLEDYQELLEHQLNIGRILIYVKNEDNWSIILKSGVNDTNYESIDPLKDFGKIQDITVIFSNQKKLRGFDFIIPILKEGVALAYVLVGDIDDEQKGMASSIKHLQFIQTLSNIIIVSIENHRLWEAYVLKEKIKKEMEMAAQLQQTLVPKADIFANDKNISVETFYMPHFEVGGDYYDFGYLSQDEMFFCIADVSGKGMAAAMVMSNFQSSLKALLVYEQQFDTLVRRLNTIVIQNCKGDKFITLFIAKYNTKTHILKYVNAGHNDPLFYNFKTQTMQRLHIGCQGIGMIDEIPVVNIGEIEISNNCKLLCFTDGVVEMERDGIRDFGQNVVEQCVCTNEDIHSTVQQLIHEANITRSNHSIKDDVTLLGIDFHID